MLSEHALLLIKIMVQAMVDDSPQWVLDLQDRHKLMVDKIFKGLEDEDEDADQDNEDENGEQDEEDTGEKDEGDHVDGPNAIEIGFGEALEDEDGVLDLRNWSECVLCGEPVDNSWERCPTCGKKHPSASYVQ